MNFTIKAHSEPECKSFLEIKKDGEEYSLIDNFNAKYPDISEKEIECCWVKYRGTEKRMNDWLTDYNDYIATLQLGSSLHYTITNEDTRISEYLINKAIECLRFARFFTLKSALILDTNFNINWKSGYVAQYYIRCIYFGTACTWYQNAMDHINQAVYWNYAIYKQAKDRDENPYDDSWDEKKIIEHCTYELVVTELKNQGLTDLRKKITRASGQTEIVRKWANFIKHKGGVDYKYLEAKDPFEIYILKKSEDGGQRFKIENFSSSVKIDIDDEYSELKKAHIALYQCIEDVIATIDYKGHALI